MSRSASAISHLRRYHIRADAADIALKRIAHRVSEWHFGIGQEAEHVLLAPIEAQQEIVADPTGFASARFAEVGRPSQRGLRLVEHEAFGDDRVVTSFDQRNQTR